MLCLGRMCRKQVALRKFSSEYWEQLYVFRIVSGIKNQ